MKYTTHSYPIQQQPTGELRSITSYTFSGSKETPHIYLQANLHGPEIFGTTLLSKLMTWLESQDDIPGTITIVPCANPIGVQQKSYSGITGRYNILSEKNWNRIFDDKQPRASVEHRLATTLSAISKDATHVIDIHTTGSATINHLFTHEEAVATFTALEPELCLLYKKENAYGAFDESHLHKSFPTFTCTWEAYHHQENNETYTELQLERLIACVMNILQQSQTSTTPSCYAITQHTELYSPSAGYLTWAIQPGETLSTDQAYATLYQPWHNKMLRLKARESFLLLGTYTNEAPAEGDPIGVVIRQ